MGSGRVVERGEEITIHDYKGFQRVTVVGFQEGTGDLLIDDGTDDLDTPRFCEPWRIVNESTEQSSD